MTTGMQNPQIKKRERERIPPCWLDLYIGLIVTLPKGGKNVL